MAKAPEYMVFDEWWNPELSDHMPAVIGREAAAGRLRAYTSDGADGKTWLVDDFVYSAGGPSSNKTAGGRAAERRAPPNPPDGEEVLVPASRPPLADAGGDQAIHDEDQYHGLPGLAKRWYDDALLLTWRRGVLWGGVGSDVPPTQLWDHGQGQRCVFHMMASKRQPAFRDLVATDHFLRLAAHAYEFRLTRHGLFLKVGRLTPFTPPPPPRAPAL